MNENNLLTVLLTFHPVLSNIQKLTLQGGELITQLLDLLTEEQLIKNILISKSPQLSPIQISLHEFALKNIHKKKCQKIDEFQEGYLVEMHSMINKIRIIVDAAQRYQLSSNSLIENNDKYMMTLFELTNILKMLSYQNIQQIEFITGKWQNIAKYLVNHHIENVIHEDLKIFLLHLSFQTHVDDQLQIHWDELIVGLQNQRNK